MGLCTQADMIVNRLHGRRALVIGGSSGVGRAISYCLADRGAHVTCHGGRNKAHLDKTISYIHRMGGKAESVFLPIKKATDILSILPDIGSIDVLIVSMGPVYYASLEETTVEIWQELVEWNLLLPSLLVSHYLPIMMAKKWGRIILFGGAKNSQGSGFRTVAAYATAKEGLSVLVRSSALQSGGKNVAVNLVSPGYIATGGNTNEKHPPYHVPSEWYVSAHRIARFVCNLVERDAADINGTILSINKGYI